MKIGSIYGYATDGSRRMFGPYACIIEKETRTTYHIAMFKGCLINGLSKLSVPKARVTNIEEMPG